MNLETSGARTADRAALSGRTRPAVSDYYRQTAPAPHEDRNPLSVGEAVDTGTGQLYCRTDFVTCYDAISSVSSPETGYLRQIVLLESRPAVHFIDDGGLSG